MSIKAPRLPDDFDESAINHGDSLSFDTSIRRFVTAPAVSHESINITGDTSLPVTHPVLTVRATAAATVGVVEDAPDGTVVTVHVAEGWERITWAPGITVTGATDTTETWVVLVRAEGAWQALVSGEPDAPATPDTGQVFITHMLDPTVWKVTDSWLSLRRHGSLVVIAGSLATNAVSGVQWGKRLISAPLPEGFRPQTSLTFTPEPPREANHVGRRVALSKGGDPWVFQQVHGGFAETEWADFDFINIEPFVYLTDDPWPA